MRRTMIVSLVAVLLLGLLGTDGHCRRREPLREMVYGRQPGARGEGMGGGGVALTGDVASSSYNPAGLGEARGLSLLISGTNYCDDGYCTGDYLYMAGSLPVRDYGVVGLSRYRYDAGTWTTIWPGGQDATPALDEIWLYTLTFATEVEHDLYAGASLNLMRSSYFGAGIDNVFYGDLGVAKVFARRLGNSSAHRLTLGTSVSNFNNARTGVPGSEEAIPVILRLGGSYSVVWKHPSSPRGLETVRFMVHTEYQDLLNTSMHNAVSLGAEVVLLEILALRFGHYREEVDDYDEPETYKDTIAETTFGWGITIPAHSLTKGSLPFNFSLDRVQLDEPALTYGSRGGDEYRILTFSLTWSL
jgi:hypothetical protein